MPDQRFEVNHKGEIVGGNVALCSNQSKILQDLFSQYNHTCFEVEKIGSYHRLKITDVNRSSREIHVYSGTVRNESRNPYEKKMQLGPNADPKSTDKHDTLIIGIYVFQANDGIRDAIFVGYPVDDRIRYETNPSLRGVYVNQLLVKAKSEGFVYDQARNTVAFRAEFAFYYLANHYAIHYEGKQFNQGSEIDILAPTVNDDSEGERIGENIILYGVPGCGKSHTIKEQYCDDDDKMERVVFHPDYTYSDFIGQILPTNIDGHISYPFTPGPFTRIMKKAVANPQSEFFLIIEEINRGNAPAIFGEVFQLLDRKNGVSEYGISNHDIALAVYADADTKVKIPKNLFLLATMNTADQNVFTLDTAFKRRWLMRSIPNDINSSTRASIGICGTKLTWGQFATAINNLIIELGTGNIGNEDKRLGAYFASESELTSVEGFSEKVLMYLWNDAFKYDHDKVFRSEYRTLDELLKGFVANKFAIFVPKLGFDALLLNASEEK